MNTASAATETAAFAARLGDEVRPLAAASAKGQVIGVFSHAMYCIFGETVVSLYGDAYGEVPFGVALADILGFLAAADASVGRSVTLGADAIFFDDRRVPIAVLPQPPRIAARLFAPDGARLERIEAYIAEHGSPRGILECFAENRGGAADSAKALAAALATSDKQTAAVAATRLLGLGRGLTPSGDDWLCGFFSLLLAARNAGLCIPKESDAVIEAVLAAAPARTSEISRAYLAAALGGKYCTVYAAVAAACLGEGDFAPYADTALQMGASSGTDTLCGALAAARLL